MFRNQYDTDCITWSPAGRIHQIEYAMEAVKQGSACIGLRSDSYALVATLKRSSSELSSYQKKIFKIDDNVCVDATMSGNIARFMNHSCAPNAISKIVEAGGGPLGKKVVVFAKRDLQVGEEPR